MNEYNPPLPFISHPVLISLKEGGMTKKRKIAKEFSRTSREREQD